MLAHAMGRGDALQARVPALTAAVGYAHVAQPTFSERPMDGRLGGHHGFGGSLCGRSRPACSLLGILWLEWLDDIKSLTRSTGQAV